MPRGDFYTSEAPRGGGVKRRPDRIACSFPMRAAIIHYWLLNMRGGEKVVEALCRMLPEADLFTLFYDPERVSETIRSSRESGPAK